MNKIFNWIAKRPLGFTVFVYLYALIATVAMIVMAL